jgi:hypothetical protein
MARVQSPIIGQAKNQAGGMIFSVWKQLKVMRSKPLSVANPRTPAQEAVRRRMALLASVCREVLQGIRLGFVRFQNGTTQWAQFLKENYATGTSDNGSTASLLVDELIFARGTLLQVAEFKISNVVGQTISCGWIDNSGQPGAASNDKLHVVLINDDGTAIAYVNTNVSRGTALVNITAPGDINPNACQVIGFFVNAASDDVSDSQYAG